jgi:hypothetical protein
MLGRVLMSETYVHGSHQRENERLEDQAGTLLDLLHRDPLRLVYTYVY